MENELIALEAKLDSHLFESTPEDKKKRLKKAGAIAAGAGSVALAGAALAGGRRIKRAGGFKKVVKKGAEAVADRVKKQPDNTWKAAGEQKLKKKIAKKYGVEMSAVPGQLIELSSKLDSVLETADSE
jgi:hypothetical protein